MAAGSASRKVIYAALAGNLAIALTKFAAAWWTGSSAMLSEGVHSAVDTSNQLLLLYGIHRASLPADEDHPLGYGRELYFWSFIVALLIFALGAGVSFYEGIAHIQAPTHITNPLVNYLVLALSAVFEGSSFAIALREFNRTRGGLGYVEAVTDRAIREAAAGGARSFDEVRGSTGCADCCGSCESLAMSIFDEAVATHARTLDLPVFALAA